MLTLNGVRQIIVQIRRTVIWASLDVSIEFRSKGLGVEGAAHQYCDIASLRECNVSEPSRAKRLQDVLIVFKWSQVGGSARFAISRTVCIGERGKIATPKGTLV